MDKEHLANSIDDFEIEMRYVLSLVDLIYALPRDHAYQAKTLEDLHTHAQAMRKAYDAIRSEWIIRALA